LQDKTGGTNMSLRKYIVNQFGHPKGMMGWLAGKIMLYRGSNRQRMEWAISLLHLHPQDRVLEIGFGPGLSIELIGKQLSEGRVAGIDHSEVMVNEAKKRMARYSLSAEIDLRCASVTNIPDFGYRFDKVLSINSFQFWPDTIESLTQIKKMMKPGAVIALVIQPRNAGATADTAKRVEEELLMSLQNADYKEVYSEWNHSLMPVPGVCVLGKA
jgi:cyclopropane fatty-acyl-phospholipid synthase-like methyltransferase